MMGTSINKKLPCQIVSLSLNELIAVYFDIGIAMIILDCNINPSGLWDI